jgi:N-acetylmuramoyl-L-alanine amidase
VKKIIIAIIAVLITFVATTVIVSAIILNGDKILTSFSIISVDNVSTNFNIRFEKVRAATHYDIIVYDEEDNRVFSQTVYRNNANLSLTMLEYDMEYTIIIYAINELGESVSVNNPFVFTYNEPSFSQENSLVLRDEENYELIVYGNLVKREYIIKLTEDNEVIKEERLTTNEYIIDASIFTDKEMILVVTIYDKGIKISQITLFNNVSPLSELKIIAPERGETLHYNDVVLSYEGGNNATSFLIQIFHGRNKIREVEVRRNRVVISMEIFRKSEQYRVVVSAKYREYDEFNKTAEVTFRMNERDTLKPAYINVFHRYVKAGTDIIITNPNEAGHVYYTIDGQDPTTNGVRYTGPIRADRNITLRTVVMEPQMNNSVVSTWDINIGTKRNFSVYLSPSNQDGNFGVRSTGYTNEMREMNHLTNYVERRLIAGGVTVFRNSPSGNINRWVAESLNHGVDLHLAIHSNASRDHRSYGIETWIHEQTSITYSLANLFQQALLSIYYIDPLEDPRADRGVKYANGAFGEVNEAFVPFGILLEVAHHDWETDAAWIMENKELIGNTIADTILKYFGLL